MQVIILIVLLGLTLMMERRAFSQDTDPGLSPLIHPKIRLIDPSKLFNRVSQNVEYVCSPFNSGSKYDSVKTAVHVYKQNPNGREVKAFLFSAYGITTSCHMKWYFCSDEEIINDIPIPMESLPRDKLLVVLNSMRNLNASEFNPNMVKQETFEEELYDCFYLQTNIKTTKVLRIRVISVVIGWSGLVVSPHIPDCTVWNSTCNMDSSSFLIIPSSLSDHYANNTCDLIEIGTFLGELLYQKDKHDPKSIKLIKFISHDSHISLTPSSIPINKYHAPCVVKKSPLMISKEGILYTIRTHAGLDLLKVITTRSKRDLMSKLFSQEATVSKVVLPHLLRSYNSTWARRHRRAILDGTPLSVSETWIYEFAASQSVAHENALDEFMNLTSYHIRQIYLDQCRDRKNSLQIGWALRDKNHRIYISALLQSDQFLSQYSNFGINWGTGELIISLDFHDFKWCDYSLLANVTSHDYSGPAIIRNLIGVAIPLKGDIQCSNHDPPSSFVIPVFSMRYYDLIINDFVKPDLPSAIDDNPLFSRLVTMNFGDVYGENSSSSTLGSSLVFAPFLTDSNINKQSMFGATRSPSWAELIVDNIIVPLLSVTLVFVLIIWLIRIIFNCILTKRSYTTNRSASFF